MTRLPDRPRLLRANTISGLLSQRSALAPDEVGQWLLDSPTSSWKQRTWREIVTRVAALSQGLRSLGVEPGDRVGIMARSTAAWDDMSYALAGARAVVVGIDVHASLAQAMQMVKHASLKGLVVDDLDAIGRFPTDGLARLSFLVALTGPGFDHKAFGGPRRITADQLAAFGGESVPMDWDMCRPDDLAAIVFTSGTTGEAKALLYRHRQVCQGVFAILDAFDDLDANCRIACWLPLSGLFQRMINIAAMSLGAQTYYVEDPRAIMDHLSAIRPQVLIAVPRFLEKVESGIRASIDRSPPWRRMLAQWAIRSGQRFAAASRAGHQVGLFRRIEHAAADRLVLARIRGAFGGALRYFVCGSAPTPVWLHERLHALGLLVLEGYAMSECMVPVASNRLGKYRFGTVGRAMSGIEIRIAEDGELLLRSEALADGYLTDSGFESIADGDGFFATGDFAEVDREGFICLRGRKSEIFKTSTGRRVAPAPIEAELRRATGIEQAAIFGADRKALVTVIVDPNIDFNDRSSYVTRLRLRLSEVLSAVPVPLRPVGAVVTRASFTIESGELTTNLKLRRHQVGEHYRAAIEALYQALERTDGTAPFDRLVSENGVIIMSL